MHFVGTSIRENKVQSKSVENCICILRNLSYRFVNLISNCQINIVFFFFRVQEVVDPKYDPNSQNSRHNNNNIRNLNARKRSKSASSNSPKSYKLFNKSKKKLTKKNLSFDLDKKISVKILKIFKI